MKTIATIAFIIIVVGIIVWSMIYSLISNKKYQKRIKEEKGKWIEEEKRQKAENFENEKLKKEAKENKKKREEDERERQNRGWYVEKSLDTRYYFRVVENEFLKIFDSKNIWFKLLVHPNYLELKYELENYMLRICNTGSIFKSFIPNNLDVIRKTRNKLISLLSDRDDYQLLAQKFISKTYFNIVNDQYGNELYIRKKPVESFYRFENYKKEIKTNEYPSDVYPYLRTDKNNSGYCLFNNKHFNGREAGYQCVKYLSVSISNYNSSFFSISYKRERIHELIREKCNYDFIPDDLTHKMLYDSYELYSDLVNKLLRLQAKKKWEEEVANFKREWKTTEQNKEKQLKKSKVGKLIEISKKNGKSPELNQAGVYLIVNNRTLDFYIGESQNLNFRRKTHIGDLTLGEHHSKLMQEHFNNYGKDVFDFYALERFTPQEEAVRKYAERRWIKDYSPTYNTID